MTTAPTNNAQRRDDDPKISDFRTTVSADKKGPCGGLRVSLEVPHTLAPDAEIQRCPALPLRSVLYRA